MIRIKPIPPLGPYPHPRLCGHVGMTPISIRIRIMSKIVPIDMVVLLLKKKRSTGKYVDWAPGIAPSWDGMVH
jgi:hypothetical protein